MTLDVRLAFLVTAPTNDVVVGIVYLLLAHSTHHPSRSLVGLFLSHD